MRLENALWDIADGIFYMLQGRELGIRFPFQQLYNAIIVIAAEAEKISLGFGEFFFDELEGWR